jgi:hypothetical protein
MTTIEAELRRELRAADIEQLPPRAAVLRVVEVLIAAGERHPGAVDRSLTMDPGLLPPAAARAYRCAVRRERRRGVVVADRDGPSLRALVGRLLPIALFPHRTERFALRDQPAARPAHQAVSV